MKKDIDLEKSGLQFISYQELQVAASESADPASSDAAEDEDTCNADEIPDDGSGQRDASAQQETPGCDEAEQEVEASQLVENIKISDPRRGTEVKLLGLRLGENTATVVAPRITVCLQCNR